VPGAARPHSGSSTPEEREKKNKKKKDKKREAAKDRAAQDVVTNGEAPPPAPPPMAIEIIEDQAETLEGDGGSAPPTPGGELSLDPLAKKIRNLNKKVSKADLPLI
jgi:translation initiation factor 2A